MAEAISATNAPARDRSALYAGLSWIAVAIGAAFYVAHFAGGRALWHDEAMLALNIVHLTPRELAGKLEYDQIAPIGWLFLERWAHQLTGNLEYGLRLVGFTAALAALVLFRALAFRMLPSLGALAATVLFVGNGQLLRYAVEAKPYIVDVLMSVAVIAAATMVIDQPRRRPLGLMLLALAGFAAVLTSFAAAYVLAAAGAAAMLKLAFERRWASAGALAVIAAAWLGVFGYLLLRIYLPQLEGGELVTGGTDTFFERTAYAPIPPKSASDIVWYVSWLEAFMEFLFRREGLFPGVLIAALGAAALVLKKQWLLILMLLGPLVIGLLASGFETYPMFDRLTLFAAPGIFLAAGAGAAWLRGVARGSVVPTVLVLALVVGASGPYIAGNLLKRKPPFSQQDVRPLLAHIKANARSDETVLVASHAIPAWALYRSEYGLQTLPWIQSQARQMHWSCLVRDLLAADARPGRRWVLVTSIEDAFAPPVENDIAPLLAERGLKADIELVTSAKKAWLFSVHLSPGPNGVTPRADYEVCEPVGGRLLGVSDRLKNRIARGP